ncbi:MAG: hypothetical protein ACI4PO_04635 [Faecousia sp.]
MRKLQVGAAKRCINPTADMFPFPPFWGTSLEGIYADMFVKALVIDNGACRLLMIVYDCGNADYEFRREISEKHGIPIDNILCVSIHNHGCPMLGHGRNSGVAEADDPRPRYQALIRREALQAVEDAIVKLRPAYFGYGEGKSYINVNRDLQLEDGSWAQAPNYEAPSDKTLAVMKFVDENGKLIAAVLNHCTHANTTFLGRDKDGKSKTCGDFPGFTCDFLEKRYGNDAVVFWTSGAAGNQNAIQCFRGDPHYTGEEDINYPAPCGLTYLYAQWLGERHAVDADRVLRGIDCRMGNGIIRTASTTVAFDGASMPEGINHRLVTLKAQNSPRIMALQFPEYVRNGKIVDVELPEPVPNGEKIPCDMQLFILGDVAIVTACAELYNEIGTLLKEKSPYRKTFVITNTSGRNPSAGYIQDDASANHRTFQHFGRVLSGNCNEIVANGMEQMFGQVLTE